MTSVLLDVLAEQPGGSRLRQAVDDAQLANVHLVGGSVRDMLRGDTPRELDVVVEGEIEPLLDALDGKLIRHERFGTAAVFLESARVDVTRARREHYEHPGALPEVEPATLAEDLLRRDFTVNAIALSLSDGALLTVPEAEADLAAGRLRVLHPESFRDDPTRLLRLGRYAARLGFAADVQTAQLAAEAVGHGALGTVSGARIGAELRLAFSEASPVGALGALAELGVLQALGFNADVPRRVLETALALLPADGDASVLLLAGLIDAGADPAATAQLLDRLQFSAAIRERALAAALAVPSLAVGLARCGRASQLRALASPVGIEAVALAGALATSAAGADSGSRGAAQAERWLAQLRHVQLEIGGGDLIAAGVPRGPEIGRRLQVTLDRRLDGELGAGREAELAAALELS